MSPEIQSIVTIAIIGVTALVFAVRTVIRIRKSRENPGCGGSCGCVEKFKPPVGKTASTNQ
ncbi:MAG: FeoB-associated Cys-rich membrane protein [Verrucomicrobiales bacterium]